MKKLLLVLMLLLATTANAQTGGFVPSGGGGQVEAAYVSAFLPLQTYTTITVAETYYPITGPFTNIPITGFIVDVDHLEYTEDATRYFEIDWHCSVSLDVSNENVHLGVKINTDDPIGIMGTTCKTAGEAYNFSGTCMPTLSIGDEIQLVITCSAAGAIVDVRHFTTTIRSIP